MSRSLSRIRSLVSEIEEIHRQGQQGHQARPVVAEKAPPVVEAKSADEEVDIFAELNDVVHLDDHRTPVFQETLQPAKISMTMTGSVALSLQIEEAGETVELKQVGNLLEIRFADGKAFHLPLKAMA